LFFCSPRLINEKKYNRQKEKQNITRGLAENFFQKVFVLNVSTVLVWIHVFYAFNNSLRLYVYKIYFYFLDVYESLYFRVIGFDNAL